MEFRHGNGTARLPRVDSFLDAKLSPPTAREEWVRRPQLVQMIDRAIDCPLTLIAAPAGYGKTTLVAQWLSQLEDRVAWVALDEADSDPVRLWTHIATAVTRAGCPIAEDVGGFVASHQTDMVTIVLPTIIDALAGLGRRLIIILDDLHFVRTTSSHEQIDFLIEHLPASASVVITTRADPSLRLGRLRVTGRLAEIRADQLCFDTDEAASLLAAGGVRLSSAALAELVARTEGWPAGLYLATLSLAGRQDPESFVHQFSGNDRFVGEYLTEEVLTRQPEDLRTFMTSVSIFDRFSAALCDHVLERTDSGSKLHLLEQSNLFLVPLDADRRWYRFHSLFGSVARSRLEFEHPPLVRSFHARGAEWFAQHGFTDEAITHALSAGSSSLAAQLLQANWLRYADAGRAATVQAWLQSLQASGGVAGAGTLVTAAWIAVLTGDEASGTRIMQDLLDLPDDEPLPDGTRSARSAVAIIRSTIGFGGPLEMLTSGRLAAELETDPASPWFGSANFGLGHAHYVTGDLEAALEALPKACYSGAAPGIIKVLALATMAMIRREHGNLEDARRLAEESMEVVASRSMHAMPQVSMAFTVLGESQAMAGNLDGGIDLLEKGLALRRKIPGLSPWPTIHHLLAMGRVAALEDDLDRAERLLDEAGHRMSRFTSGMEAMRARLSTARSALGRRHSLELTGQSLTGREVDVLRCLQSQLNLSEIASKLFLSRNTVKTHTQAVYRKLGASSRSEAVRIGRQRYLI